MILMGLRLLQNSRAQVTGNKALQGKPAKPDSVFKLVTEGYLLGSSDFAVILHLK